MIKPHFYSILFAGVVLSLCGNLYADTAVIPSVAEEVPTPHFLKMRNALKNQDTAMLRKSVCCEMKLEGAQMIQQYQSNNLATIDEMKLQKEFHHTAVDRKVVFVNTSKGSMIK
jgi:hypothetical protein